jgi:ABC-type molybdenum transport system ATPase subunit/photorepair protein PhrA
MAKASQLSATMSTTAFYLIVTQLYQDRRKELRKRLQQSHAIGSPFQSLSRGSANPLLQV